MQKRIVPLVAIFVCTSLAWIILGGVTAGRTFQQDAKLRQAVGQLWGTAQKQQAPSVYSRSPNGDKSESKPRPITLEGSDIKVGLRLDHRKKGLLWYSTYRVGFSAKYLVVNSSEEKRDIFFNYAFPSAKGIYDGFSFAVNGEQLRDLQPTGGTIAKKLNFGPGETKTVEIAYESQGMDEWWYLFGSDVSQIRNFKLTMTTDFKDIDFPDNSISPTAKNEKGKGWELKWEYDNLISGIQIGMDMPQKLNPGPFASKVSFFAPVSLFLFLFIMFIITTGRNIKIHPMNYFFISAAFFSFHLLLAYLVDHIDIYLAFAICSAVSILLVVSYMRLVAGARFALLETGLSQFVYLVLFSYVFFFEGYTGLAITIGCILTLFVVMQFTGKIDWEKQIAGTNGD
jgi:hypothetical protein